MIYGIQYIEKTNTLFSNATSYAWLWDHHKAIALNPNGDEIKMGLLGQFYEGVRLCAELNAELNAKLSLRQ
jgi:hypothetical protein